MEINSTDKEIEQIANTSHSDNNLLSFKDNYNLDNKKQRENNKVTFSKMSIYLVYTLFAVLNILVNMDSGNIPPATVEISKDLDITDRELGGFASFVSFGTFIGGIISLSLINLFSRKLILIIANGLMAITLFTFPIFYQLYILYFNRIISGIFMVSKL